MPDLDPDARPLHLLPALPVAYPVASRLVSHVGYDPGSSRLVVVFRRDSSAYCYARVDADCWAQLCTADSIGRFVARQVVDRYPYRRIGADPDLPADAAVEAQAIRVLVDRLGVPLTVVAASCGQPLAAVRACYTRGDALPDGRGPDTVADLLDRELTAAGF